MSLAIDASITLAWYFDDERTAATDAILDRVIGEGGVVPPLWRYEVANGLQMAVRRRRIDAAYRDASLAELRLLPISLDRGADDLLWTAVISLADRFRVTVYDAAYLELAHRLGLPLATTDRQLRAAARTFAVTLA